MRCFVGLPLPEVYQQGLKTIAETWRPKLRSRMTWTRPGNWHLTLFFLGDIPEEAGDRVQEALAAVRQPRFQLKAGGGGFFPPGGKKPPRVVWAGLDRGDDECTGLAARVRDALVQLGFQADQRPFRPHLTLARVKQAKGGDDWAGLLRDLNAREWPPVDMLSFVLWQSSLKPSGPEYAVLREFPLDLGP